MANPYESTGGEDPFKEASSSPSTVAPDPSSLQPVTLNYTIPSQTPVGTEGSLPEPANPYLSSASRTSVPPATTTVPLNPAGAPPAGKSDAAASPAATSSYFSLQFYQSFFDVSTRQVLYRMTNALVPVYPPDFLEHRHWHVLTPGPTEEEACETTPDEPPVIAGVTLSRYPDLYGPFWIATTLWITICVVNNMMGHLAAALDSSGAASYAFDFKLLPIACSTAYLYIFGVSALIWGVLKWKYLSVPLMDIVCLYGYSLFLFVLTALLCVVPSNALRWSVVLLGGVWSAGYILANLWHVLKFNLPPVWFVGVAGAVVMLHLALTLSFKFYFFHYSI